MRPLVCVPGNRSPNGLKDYGPCFILPSFQDENHSDLLLASLVWIAACISPIQRLSTDLVYKVLLGALLKRSVPEKRGRITNLWPPSRAVGHPGFCWAFQWAGGAPESRGQHPPLPSGSWGHSPPAPQGGGQCGLGRKHRAQTPQPERQTEGRTPVAPCPISGPPELGRTGSWLWLSPWLR